MPLIQLGCRLLKCPHLLKGRQSLSPERAISYTREKWPMRIVRWRGGQSIDKVASVLYLVSKILGVVPQSFRKACVKCWRSNQVDLSRQFNQRGLSRKPYRRLVSLKSICPEPAVWHCGHRCSNNHILPQYVCF